MLDALGNLGDFIGGIGVLVTLVYLALQIRQNTRAVRASSRLEIAKEARQMLQFSAEPARDAAFTKGLSAFPDLTREERRNFHHVVADILVFFQGVFAMREARQLDDETYEGYLDWVASILATPGGAAYWRMSKGIFVQHMVREIDARLARGGVPDIIGADPTLQEVAERPGAVSGAVPPETAP